MLQKFKVKAESVDYTQSHTCKVCSHIFTGLFCNACGEKIPLPDEKSFKYFAESILNGFTFFEGKFFSTIKLLLQSPGSLSHNISEGICVPYMKLVSLFFLANFLYFLFPVFDTFNSSLYTQLTSLGNHSELATSIVKQYTEKNSMSMEDFQNLYQNQSTNLSKLLIVVLVLLLSGILFFINYNKQKFYFDHLLFSLEIYAFHLLFNLLALAHFFVFVIWFARQWGLNWGILLSDSVFSFLTQFTLLYFIVRGLHTGFQNKWYWAIPKAVVIYYLIIQSIHVYRISLFYITMWFL
jgi:hypothetical protein